MPPPSISASVIVAAIGVLLFPALITSQGRRISALEVEDTSITGLLSRERCS